MSKGHTLIHRSVKKQVEIGEKISLKNVLEEARHNGDNLVRTFVCS